MRCILSLIVFAVLVMPAYAADNPQKARNGGFQGPVTGAQAETVAKAKTLGDDAAVILTGHIVSQVAGTKDRFNFRDETGEIVVEIKNRVFGGRTVTPEDKVRIAGKTDKDLGESMEIDAKVLELVK